MAHAAHELALEAVIADEIRAHRGRQAAIGMRELAAACGVETRFLQRIVKHLIEDHGEPIGSSTVKPTGYYWLDDPDDVAASVRQLEHRLVSLAVRIARLRKTSVEAVFGQLNLGV